MTTTDSADLETRILALAASPEVKDEAAARALLADFLCALERGDIRAARPTDRGWEAVHWVKTGILQTFRVGKTAPFPSEGSGEDGTSGFRFFDRDTLPLRETRGVEEQVRIVPGGSSVRAGAHLGANVVIMPPAYVNIGAWVGEGSMVDSHALVGSCAQVGRGVHLSAGAQLGGVLEPVGLRPVVVEDEAMIGANCGVFEGVLVGRRAVLAPGVNLTAATVLHDLVNETVHRSSRDAPLSVPDGAVVVPGSRPAAGDWARGKGLQLYAPVIVKYRDERTDAATALEEVLR
ncbi:MAG: 2,3,4,5-tetrahydropyridine-2,6-dicarboxylate N-succinyltransferase [Gemmatimonadales bacterium]|nr:MAG: 2,3,4,5-tetrahydropyridine-2,6-dicarboxylate N-succinyltransferase [Gemmatimonadales bacterium]